MAAPAPSPSEEADVSAAHELRADALLLGCVVVGLVRVLHVVNLTINLFKEIKAVQEDAGRRGMGEHMHDRDQTGRRPPVAKAVLLDQMLHDLSRDKRAPSALRRRQLSLKLRSTLVIAARRRQKNRARGGGSIRCAVRIGALGRPRPDACACADAHAGSHWCVGRGGGAYYGLPMNLYGMAMRVGSVRSGYLLKSFAHVQSETHQTSVLRPTSSS